jgi:hypothetical protein
VVHGGEFILTVMEKNGDEVVFMPNWDADAYMYDYTTLQANCDLRR